MKHAYLIMAHNEIDLLKLLLRKLDYENNTIYLHCDTKFNCNLEEFRAVLNVAELHFIKRLNVQWGKYSQIQCELELLKKALEQEHDYYHLLSGVDLPIKSHEEIDAFFEEHKGTEFVSYDKKSNETQNFINRFNKWHFRLPSRTNNNIKNRFIWLCNIPLIMLEKTANLLIGNRSKKYPDITFMKGSTLFDITHELASYVVKKEDFIKKAFKFSSCCDEVFLQTIAYNSPFAKNIASYNIRYIDWSKHGKSPELLTLDHYESIINSEHLFARKFSSIKSKELIEKLYGIDF